MSRRDIVHIGSCLVRPGECTFPMDVGLRRHQPDPQEGVTSPYAVWAKDLLEVAFDQVRRHSGQAVQRQKQLYDQWAV